jgi:hypothetical protein
MFPKRSWLLAQLLQVPQLQVPQLQPLSLSGLQLIVPVSVLSHPMWPAVSESML